LKQGGYCRLLGDVMIAKTASCSMGDKRKETEKKGGGKHN